MRLASPVFSTTASSSVKSVIIRPIPVPWGAEALFTVLIGGGVFIGCKHQQGLERFGVDYKQSTRYAGQVCVGVTACYPTLLAARAISAAGTARALPPAIDVNATDGMRVPTTVLRGNRIVWRWRIPANIVACT